MRVEWSIGYDLEGIPCLQGQVFNDDGEHVRYLGEEELKQMAKELLNKLATAFPPVDAFIQSQKMHTQQALLPRESVHVPTFSQEDLDEAYETGYSDGYASALKEQGLA